jgi:hypothetical protein
MMGLKDVLDEDDILFGPSSSVACRRRGGSFNV